MAVTSLAAQDKQRQVEAQQRLIELAKEVWKCFPTECEMMAWGTKEDSFCFGVKLPKHRFRPSLLDSLNVAFAEAIPTATYASAMKYNRLDNGKDSISYTMTWDNPSPNGHITVLTNPIIRSHHVLPVKNTSDFNLALLDNLNDSIFLHLDLLWHMTRQTTYDISDFESMLEEVKKTYPNKHQKVKFPQDGFPTLKGDKYVITCNADSVFDVLSQYGLRHYWYEDSPMVLMNYAPAQNLGNGIFHGQTMNLLLFSSKHLDNDRYIELTVCANKLLLLDLKNLHDDPDDYQYLYLYPGIVPHTVWSPNDWIQKLEPELYQFDQALRRKHFNN